MTTVDIFIKTCHKDYIWLEYLLKSIKKFASGFRDVVIVSEPEYPIPESFLEITPAKVFYEPIPKNQPKNVHHGVGYLWQQNIKLNWIQYSDADAVLVMDSDQILTVPTTPSDFKINGKFSWFYRKWENAEYADCWKDPTTKFLKLDPKYEAMCIPIFILQRETTIAFKNFVCGLHKTTTIWDIFLKYNMPSFSEFNAFGSFVYHSNRNEYNRFVVDEIDTSKLHNRTIRTRRSWEGLSEEEKIIQDKILS